MTVQHIYKEMHMLCTIAAYVHTVCTIRTYECTMRTVQAIPTYYMYVHYKELLTVQEYVRICTLLICRYIHTFLQTLHTEELKDTLETKTQEFQEEKNVCTFSMNCIYCIYCIHIYVMWLVFLCNMY